MALRNFGEIFAMAAERKGGVAALENILTETRPLEPAVIAAMADNRVLATITRRIFYAGFSPKVIDGKWDAFEGAFDRFDPHFCAFMTEDHIDALMRNRSIVRNGAKIRSVQINAQFVLDLAVAHGSAARFFAEWPDDNYVGLLDVLKMRASHLGGQAAMRWLRALGKPSFVTSRDVVAALIREGVLVRAPSGKRDLAAIQGAFNWWSSGSGRDLTAISRVLAMSIGNSEQNHPPSAGGR
jgi:3-methyladenine DNA glycosylase Tag